MSSVGVVNTGTDWIEVGFADTGPNLDECDGTTTGTNKPYYFRFDDQAGTPRCFQGGYHTDTADYGISFGDFNLDTKWQATLNGNDVGGKLDEDFSTGYVVTNDERHASSDLSGSLFRLTYFGNGGGWQIWNDAACGPISDDTVYNNQIVAEDHIEVSTQPADCVP